MNKKYGILIFLLLLANWVSAQQKELSYYLQEGLSQSPLLQDYNNQILGNLVDSARIRASYRPQVTASSTNSYAPVIRGWGYDEAISNGRNINGVIGVNQALVSKKNIGTQLESVTLLNKGLQNTKAISEQDLKKSIIAQYITAYGDGLQLNYLEETCDLLKTEEVLLKKLTESNVYRQTDYLTFLVALQQQELAKRQAAIQLQNDLATLNYLAGVVDTGTVVLAEPSLTVTTPPVIEESVFFKQYAFDSLSIVNKKALVDFSYKPRLSVFGDAGYNSTLQLTPYKNFGFNFGFSVSVPIYDGKQRKMQYTRLAIEEDTRSNYKRFFARQYTQQLAQLWQQLNALQGLAPDIEHQVKYSDALIKANAKLLSTGDVRIADMIIALNNYLAAKNLLTQNRISKLQLINQINYWNR